MPDGRRRGAQPLSDRDWLFGSRRLLERVLLAHAPASGWTRPELADAAGVVANGGVDEHVEGLVRLGVLRHSADANIWLPVQPRPPLAKALRTVLVRLQSVGEAAPVRGARPSPSAALRARAALRVAQRALAEASGDLDTLTLSEVQALIAAARVRLEAGT